jgi:hypothetical protein
MNGPKTTSALSPFDSQLRTLVGAARMSQKGQVRTHAPQNAIENAWISAPARAVPPANPHFSRSGKPLGSVGSGPPSRMGGLRSGRASAANGP